MKKYTLITLIAFIAILQSCSVLDINNDFIDTPKTQNYNVEEFPLDGKVCQIKYKSNTNVGFYIEEIEIDNADLFGHGYGAILHVDDDGMVYTPWPFLISKEIFPDGIEATVTLSITNTTVQEIINLKITIDPKDPIEESLTTSLDAYQSAEDGDWIEVSKEEYSSVQNAYYEIVKIGTTDERMEETIISPASADLWAPGGDDGVSVSFSRNHIGYDYHGQAKQHIGALIGVCYYNPSEGDKIGCNVKIEDSELGLFSKHGNNLPSHEGIGMHYFINKNKSREVLTGKKYLGFHAKDLARFELSSSSSVNCRYNVGDTGYHPLGTFSDFIVQGFFSSRRQR